MRKKLIKRANISFNNDKYIVSGELDFFNIVSVYQKSLMELRKSSCWKFDFVNLKSSNSAGLALIIEWIKLAKKNNIEIKFINLSEEFLSIAEISGIDQLILHSCDH